LKRTFHLIIISGVCELKPTSDNIATGGTPTNNSKFSSVSVTFRFHKHQLNQLRQEAKEKRISLNTLASQIFDSYMNYNSKISKADIIPITKQELMSLLEGYDEKKIKTKARQNAKKVGKDAALLLRGKYDFEALVDIFESWLKATGFPYRHNEDVNKNRHTFIVQHKMGRKYSVFLSEGSKTYFEPLVTKKVEYSITDNSIAITLQGGEAPPPTDDTGGQ
jgi:hypothetical protein